MARKAARTTIKIPARPKATTGPTSTTPRLTRVSQQTILGDLTTNTPSLGQPTRKGREKAPKRPKPVPAPDSLPSSTPIADPVSLPTLAASPDETVPAMDNAAADGLPLAPEDKATSPIASQLEFQSMQSILGPTQPVEPVGKNAVWTPAEMAKFLQLLLEYKSEQGDGGLYTMVTMNKVAKGLRTLLERGAVKDGKKCKTKWTWFRNEYIIVKAIRNNSGWDWNDEDGAGITPARQGTWDDYVAKNPDATPYRNRGWAYWEAVDQLMPRKDRGEHVYRARLVDDMASQPNQPFSPAAASEPTESSAPATQHSWFRAESPPWNESQLERDFNSQKKGEHDSSDTEFDTKPSSRTPSAKKRPSEERSTPASHKRVRLTSSQQMIMNMGRGIENIGDKLVGMFAPVPAPVVPQVTSTAKAISHPLLAEAVQKAMTETWLDKCQRMDLIKVFRQNEEDRIIYLALDDDATRKDWIQETLQDYLNSSQPFTDRGY